MISYRFLIAAIAAFTLSACSIAEVKPQVSNVVKDAAIGAVLANGSATHNEINATIGDVDIPVITIDANAGGNDGEVKACVVGHNDTLAYVAEVLNYNDGAVLQTLREMMIGDENSTKSVLDVFRKMEAAKNMKRIKTMPLDLGVVIPRPKFSKGRYKVSSPEAKEAELIKYNVELIKALKKANKRLDNIRAWRRSVK